MTVYHVTNKKKAMIFLKNGFIDPPVRAWENIKQAERFSKSTHRKVILRLKFPADAPESAAAILMAVEGDAATLIRSIGAGVTCSPEDPPEMANAINTIRYMSDKEREIMGKAGKNAFLQEFRRDIIVDKYEKVLQDISYKECIEEAR